jgi:choline dehydrogenase
VTQLRPESCGSIHIKSPDLSIGPAIHPNFLSSAQDQDCIVKGMQIAREIVSQPAMQLYIESEMTPGFQVQSSSDWLTFARENGQTIYHPIGTCRMGEDSNAVVDSKLRVHGLIKLRIVDASIMPSMISGNIQAAVMMIAERGASLILEDARR